MAGECAPRARSPLVPFAILRNRTMVAADLAAFLLFGAFFSFIFLATLMMQQLILLGTSGGPPEWPGSTRAGIASALLVGDRYYIIDASAGVVRQAREARPSD